MSDVWNLVREEEADISQLQNRQEPYYLSWHEATKLLEKRNLNLISAREYTENIFLERKNQWKTWLPRPSVFANLNSSLAQLGNLTSSDLSASIIAPLVIPNPYTEIAQAFENSLSHLQSVDNYQLSYRREIISLYRLFSRMERLKNGSTDTRMEEGYSVTKGLSSLNKLDSEREQLENLQSELVQLLNLPGKKPTPLASSRPKIDYESRLDTFIMGENYGKLVMRLASYNIEAALLREKGVKLRKWPSLNFNISTPTIYNSQNTNQNPINADDTHLFGGLFKSYDFLGSEAKNIKTAKQNTEYVKTNLRLQLDRDISSWKSLLDKYKKIQISKQLARERLSNLRVEVSGITATDQLKSLRDAINTFSQLEQSKEQLDLEIWMWDDDAWK